jgi:hypothetical protein
LYGTETKGTNVNYYRKSWDIVGYTYAAENYCGGCVVEAAIARGELSPGARGMTVEAALDQWAVADGIDREDESSFDSDVFPKVVFEDQRLQDELCGSCGGEL